jgi:hypothetical protein
MPSLLSAASLVITMIALLYSVWYPELRRAADVEVRGHEPKDRSPETRQVEGALHRKAWPLLLAAAVPIVVFTPNAFGVIANALATIGGGPGASEYDAVQAAFVAVYALSIGLWVVILTIVRELRSKVRLLRKPGQ